MALMWKDVVAKKRDAQTSAIAAFTDAKRVGLLAHQPAYMKDPRIDVITPGC